MFQKLIDPLYIGLVKFFFKYLFLKRLDKIKSDFSLQSSLLTLYFSGRLSVQYTLNTLYVTPTHNFFSSKTYRGEFTKGDIVRETGI